MSFLVYVKRPSELCLFLSRSRLSLGLVSVLSRLGLGDNFLFGLVSLRKNQSSLVSDKKILDTFSRSRSRAIILKIKFLGLGLVQKLSPSYYSVSVSSKKSGLVPP